MKKMKIAFALATALMLSAAGCNNEKTEQTPPTMEPAAKPTDQTGTGTTGTGTMGTEQPTGTTGTTGTEQPTGTGAEQPTGTGTEQPTGTGTEPTGTGAEGGDAKEGGQE